MNGTRSRTAKLRTETLQWFHYIQIKMYKCRYLYGKVHFNTKMENFKISENNIPPASPPAKEGLKFMIIFINQNLSDLIF